MNDAPDMKSLDILFQPSEWSKRFSTPEEVLNAHMAFTVAGKSLSLAVNFTSLYFGVWPFLSSVALFRHHCGS